MYIDWRKLLTIAACIVGRQFPDKAIDLIDEACVTAIKESGQIVYQEENENDVQSSCANAMKNTFVGPEHVAQVGILFLMIFVLLLQLMRCAFIHVLTLLFEGCEPMDWDSCHYA
jgi:hypothetical protein